MQSDRPWPPPRSDFGVHGRRLAGGRSGRRNSCDPAGHRDVAADLHERPPTTAQCEAQFQVACYSPNQIERAYDLPALYAKGYNGAGKTIVIVDSFGSTTVRHDLAVFDAAFHLPAPPSFKIIQPAGAVPHPNAGWAGETDLDVEYSHAIAPGANILLVETPTSENEGTTGFPQIVEAENYVINHHLGDVISQSFSATEETFPTKQSLLNLRSAYINAAAKGVTVNTASGDLGRRGRRVLRHQLQAPPGHVVARLGSAGHRHRWYPAASQRQGQPHRPGQRLE